MKIYAIDNHVGFIIRWFCQPPEMHEGFICKRDNWVKEGELWVREIFEIELVS